MARKSVGDLVVAISADAKNLNSVIDGAESRMVAFSNRIAKVFTDPSSLASGFIGGVAGGAAVGLLDKMAGYAWDAGQKALELTEILGGTRIEMQAWRSPIESAQKAMERLFAVGKGADDFGVGPQFLRGLEIAAGPEADKLDKILVKLLKVKAETHDLGTNESFIRKIIGDGAALDSAEARIMKAANLVGDKQAMGLVELYQGGIEALDKAIAKVEKLGLAHQGNITLAQQWRAVLKDVEKLEQAAQERAMMSGGLMDTGLKRIMAGDTSRGIDELNQGIDNWVGQRLGREQELTQLQSREFVTKARSGMLDMLGYSDPSKRDKLQDILGFVNEREAALSGIGGKASMVTIDTVSALLKQAEQIAGPKPKTDTQAVLDKQAAAAKSMAEQAALSDKLATELDILENTFGGTAKTIEQYTAIMNGATAANVELIGKTHDLRDAQAILAANKSPADLAAEQLDRLDSLRGTLGDAEYAKALRRMRAKPADIAVGDANTALVGSQEWAKAFSRSNQPAEQKDDEQLDILKKQLQVDERIEERLRELNQNKPGILRLLP